MSRVNRTYGERTAPTRVFAGADISEPVAGFYRCKLRGGAIVGGVRLWFGPPHDPVTGEVMDRSYRWQAEFDGDPVDLDDVWPLCAGSPISERDYREFVGRREWARANAPGSAFADPRKRYDPLSTQNPMPF